MSQSRIGTSIPIFVGRNLSDKVIEVGRGHFIIQVVAAQVVVSGAPWQKPKRALVTSKVCLNHPDMPEETWSIQRSIPIVRNEAVQLGIRPNLVSLVPATMPKISISMDVIIDRENSLANLAELINVESLLTVVSLAPAQVLAARAISQVVQKLLHSLLPAESSDPILQFSGEFNLAASGQTGQNESFREGYYVIFAAPDAKRPLPSPYSRITVRDSVVLNNDLPVTDLSYVLLNVCFVETRPRELNDGAAWETLLTEAEFQARRLGEDPDLSLEARKRSWQRCLGLLDAAQRLMKLDPNYLPTEVELIVQASHSRCRKLMGKHDRMRSKSSASTRRWMPKEEEDFQRLGISSTPYNVQKALDMYAKQVIEARRRLRSMDVSLS